MEIIENYIDEMTLKEFGEKYGLTLKITEHLDRWREAWFSASFVGVEALERSCLTSYYGKGTTKDEAIADYAKIISCIQLVHGAYTDERREFPITRIVNQDNKTE